MFIHLNKTIFLFVFKSKWIVKINKLHGLQQKLYFQNESLKKRFCYPTHTYLQVNRDLFFKYF